MQHPSPLLVIVFSSLWLAAGAASGQTAGAPRNLVANGGFESGFRRENLWDGVDSAGYLSGERGALPILTQSGAISDSAMPLSVNIADMNGDGLPDVVTADFFGYVRIFFNEGSRTEPRFGVGEMAGTFLTRVAPNDPALGEAARPWVRRAPRLTATDIMKTGRKDLVLGNFIGEVLLVPNAGTAQRPEFKQPQDPGRLVVPTTKDSNQRWGNLFAPCTWDWDGDGKEDILLGEGSYSANNIHLILNKGSSARPVFDETNHFILAYGDGLEQLSPAVVDANGDGLPDLLVGERSGKIALYLNKGERVGAGEPPPELPFTSFLSGSGSSPLVFGGIPTVATGDLNGDGIFDLVVGKTNGRIALAMNIGTKQESKFAAPIELKGTPGTPPLSIPSGWDVDYGLERGNYYARLTTVKAEEDPKAQPPEGNTCLRIDYEPSPNKIMAPPAVYTPGFPGFEKFDRLTGYGSTTHLTNAPARSFMLKQGGRFRLALNKRYALTFKVKGTLSDGVGFIGWGASKELSEARVTQGDRGSASIQRNVAQQNAEERFSISPGATWTEVRKEFLVKLSNRDLQNEKEASGVLQIGFTMPQGGSVYFDDFKIVELP